MRVSGSARRSSCSRLAPLPWSARWPLSGGNVRNGNEHAARADEWVENKGARTHLALDGHEMRQVL